MKEHKKRWFTRDKYLAIAKAVLGEVSTHPMDAPASPVALGIANRLADLFTAEYPEFDRDLFLSHCGLK